MSSPLEGRSPIQKGIDLFTKLLPKKGKKSAEELAKPQDVKTDSAANIINSKTLPSDAKDVRTIPLSDGEKTVLKSLTKELRVYNEMGDLTTLKQTAENLKSKEANAVGQMKETYKGLIQEHEKKILEKQAILDDLKQIPDPPASKNTSTLALHKQFGESFKYIFNNPYKSFVSYVNHHKQVRQEAKKAKKEELEKPPSFSISSPTDFKHVGGAGKSQTEKSQEPAATQEAPKFEKKDVSALIKEYENQGQEEVKKVTTGGLGGLKNKLVTVASSFLTKPSSTQDNVDNEAQDSQELVRRKSELTSQKKELTNARDAVSDSPKKSDKLEKKIAQIQGKIDDVNGVIDKRIFQAIQDLSDKELKDLLEGTTKYVSEKGLEKEGIFRLSGGGEGVRELLARFILNKEKINEGEKIDSVDMAAFIKRLFIEKQFFSDRDLENLNELSKEFGNFNKISEMPEAQRMQSTERIREIIKGLPKDKQDSLNLLLNCCQRVAASSDKTKMSETNLAIVLSPSTLTPKGEEPILGLALGAGRSKLFEMMIVDREKIFTAETTKKIPPSVPPRSRQSL